MSSLFLIRHGQASFGAHDYDLLSERGRLQSELLGEHFKGRELRFDAAYTGPRRRQRDTAQWARATASGQLGAAIELADLDEYPAFELIAIALPQLADRSPAFAQLAKDPQHFSSRRGADALLTAMLESWIDGSLETKGLETYAAFASRTRRVLREIQAAEGRGKAVAIFTSGGPIAQAVLLTLGLPDEKMIPLTRVIHNASITELRYRGDELALATFNETPHLRRDQLSLR